MADKGQARAVNEPLAGETLFLFGRMHGVTRRRLEQLAHAHGGRLVRKPSPCITMIAVGHSAALNALVDGRLCLPAGLPDAAAMVSELQLRRRLGLLDPIETVERSLTAAALERHSRLAPPLLSCLALFDVLEPVDDRYAYRDLVAAREVSRLLARGIELRQILQAAVALRRRGHHLSETRLTEGPSGELVRELSGQLAEFSGQLTMPLDRAARSIDELVAAAESAEETGDLATAESLYTTALRADANDPVLPFNLGNIFAAQGRSAEAKIAWQIAVAREPAFAEAWYNLAMAAEDEEQTDLAVAQYHRAVRARSDYADAHFNLALLLTKMDHCAEALPLWDRFLELEPHSQQARTARRAAALCRMHIKRAQMKVG